MSRTFCENNQKKKRGRETAQKDVDKPSKGRGKGRGFTRTSARLGNGPKNNIFG